MRTEGLTANAASRLDPSGEVVARSLLEISELDSRVQEEIAKYGSVKDFHIALWRQEPDRTESNWNARIQRINGSPLDTFTWWDVVPEMRERFNLV
jgi:hypothetical protein